MKLKHAGFFVTLPPEFLAHLERQAHRLPTQEEIDQLELDGSALDWTAPTRLAAPSRSSTTHGPV